MSDDDFIDDDDDEDLVSNDDEDYGKKKTRTRRKKRRQKAAPQRPSIPGERKSARSRQSNVSVCVGTLSFIFRTVTVTL